MARALPAVSYGTGPRIMLAGGSWFDLLDPWNSDFTIEDIAQGLSNICRYAGQCRQFYSVAEHSLHVSSVAGAFKREALLHDAAEAFLGDITRPLKQLLPQYKKIEKDVEAAIFTRFNLNTAALKQLKAIDLSVLAAEQEQMMPTGTDYWTRETGITPAKINIRFWQPDQAKKLFLAEFCRLTKQPL